MPPEGTEIVGPVVGKQLRRQGILATVLALARHPGLHRAAVPVELRGRRDRRDAARPAGLPRVPGVLPATSSRSTSSPALLTITGYSVNDTIVIFDRVRENMRDRMRARQPLDDDRQHRGQPDAEPHGHHRRHDVAERDGAVPVRRRSARRASPSRCSSASSAAPTRRCSSPRRSRSCCRAASR